MLQCISYTDIKTRKDCDNNNNNIRFYISEISFISAEVKFYSFPRLLVAQRRVCCWLLNVGCVVGCST